MRTPASAPVLVLGLLGALGAAYLASAWLAPAPPRARAAGAAQAPVAPAPREEPAAAKPRKVGAYVEQPVEAGGTIRIFCRLSKAVEVQQVPYNKDQQGCGHPAQPSERCLFDPATLGLANCVVGLTDIQQGKAFEGELAEKGRLVLLDQRTCRYEPHVMLMRSGQQVSVRNSDPVQHNVHAYFKGLTQFNEMSSSNSTLQPFDTGRLTSPGLYPLKCDIHYWMTGFIHVVRHPYHAVSGADGRCELTRVPAGQYRIGCWHEGMRVTLQMAGALVSGYEFSADVTAPEQVVDVPAGGTVDVVFTLDPK